MGFFVVARSESVSAEAGLVVEVSIDYDAVADDRRDPILCFVCRKGHTG